MAKKICDSILETVGETPLVRLSRLEEKEGLEARILAKVEAFNPAGSAKDRIALNMIREAELSGRLRKGSVIIEPTSGNTGIGLAMVCAVKGYRVILTMPETMSVERQKLLAAYGAELVLTEGARGIAGAVEEAARLAEEIPDSFQPGQFVNQANPDMHMRTTGPEIWRDTAGEIDFFVAGVGTGGTITGTGAFLKKRNPEIRVVAVQPAGSPLLTGGKAGPHPIQGIGANFIPEILDMELYDEVLSAGGDAAVEAAAALAKTEGILAGISSGAAVWAAVELARRPENKGKTIVAFLPDTGERYLSL